MSYSFEAVDVISPYSWPEQEEKVLQYWREIDAFQEQVRQSEGRPPYSFYDGPVSTQSPTLLSCSSIH
jgi:isoleucyl-tRNA synthetase